MQAMAAAYLGKRDRSSARAVLVRTLQISSALGVGLGLLLAAFKTQVVSLFTNDAAVAALACAIMPVIAVCMPLDAAASITDGGLIAAGQTNALSVIQVLGTLVQYGVMAMLINMGLDSVVYVWAVLKVMTLARLGGGLYIHFGSRRSAYGRFKSSSSAGAAAAAAPAAAEAAEPAVDNVQGQAAGPAAEQATSAAGSSAGSTSSSGSNGSSSNGTGVLVGGSAAPQQQPMSPPPGWSHVPQPVPPQQHQIMMHHQQQQPQRPIVPTIGGAAAAN